MPLQKEHCPTDPQDSRLSGVHDTDEEPGSSDDVVRQLPVHEWQEPDLRRVLTGECCLRAGGMVLTPGRPSRITWQAERSRHAGSEQILAMACQKLR